MAAADYFTLFGLPARFALDRSALDTAYRALQAEVHPDKFAHAMAATQRQAMERATSVNEAYATLKAPVARGRYLLQQLGIEAFDPANTRMSNAFLMQQIDWREQLEAALQIARETADLAPLEALDAVIAEAAQQHEQQLATLLDGVTVGCAVRTDQQDAAQAAAFALRELRFIERLAEEIHAAFDAVDG